MNDREIGEMIKIRRFSRNMTQADLAAASCLSKSAIAMYETGKRRPSQEAAEALADAFNVPVWSIFYRESEMQPIVPTDDASKPRKWRMLSAGALTLTDEQLDKLYALAHLLHPDEFPLEEDEGKDKK